MSRQEDVFLDGKKSYILGTLFVKLSKINTVQYKIKISRIILGLFVHSII